MMATSPPQLAIPADPPFDREASYQAYLAALLSGDRERCRACFEQWLAATADLRTLYEDLVQRSLYAVGEQWQLGKISVAAEHLATAISDSLLHLCYPRLFGLPRTGQTVVVAATANEQHHLGARMVADIFELHGWHAHFLGANTPQSGLLELIGRMRADAVALSSTVSANLPRLLQTARGIRAEFPDLPIIVGGQALRRGGQERVEQIAKVHCLNTLADLESWLSDTNLDVRRS